MMCTCIVVAWVAGGRWTALWMNILVWMLIAAMHCFRFGYQLAGWMVG